MVPIPEKVYFSHSSVLYEGVLSQKWELTDPKWEKLNVFSSTLCEVKYDGSWRCNQQDILATLIYLLDKFKNTTKPIAIVKQNCWENVSFDENFGLRYKSKIVKHTIIQNVTRGRLIVLMARIYYTLKLSQLTTKRDLFYKDTSIFKKQDVSNNLIDKICCITGYTRRQLNILSTPKGLVYGDLSFDLIDEKYNCSINKYGLLISQDFEMMTNIQSKAKFILIIEKHATFQYLISANIAEKFPMIMITGKGFPDLDTRRLIAVLYNKLMIPVFGLSDANPWGLEIMCTYRYGSLSMAHEAERCNVPSLRWIGLLPSDIEKFVGDKFNVQKLTQNDINKLNSLKHRPYIKQNEQWKIQIKVLEKYKFKAELQAVTNIVETFLPFKIKKGLWI